MTLLAGWGALLARSSGQDDVVIGVPAASREQKEVENLIGFFVNTLAMRLELSGSPTASKLLQRMKACSRSAQQSQDIPFDQEVESVRPLRSPSFHPVFQACLSGKAPSSDSLGIPDVRAKRLPRTGAASTEFDLPRTRCAGRRRMDCRRIGICRRAVFTGDNRIFWDASADCCRKWRRRKEDQAIDRLPIVGAARKESSFSTSGMQQSGISPRDKCAHQII